MKSKTRCLNIFSARPCVFTFTTALVVISCMSSAHAANRTWIASPADGNWSVPGNWGGTAPIANDVVLFGTSSVTAHTNSLAANLVLNGITYNAGSDAFTFTGNAVNLNGNIANNGSNPQSIGFPLGFQTGTVTVSGAANLTLGGKITSGILGGVVGADRTLTNNLTAGTLSLADIDLSISPDAAVRNFTISGTGNTSVTGVIANGSAAANRFTYSGTGILAFNGAAAHTYTGSTTINSGTFNLDFSNLPVPTNFLGLSNLTLGGNFILTGKNGAATAQTFNGITANSNRSAAFTVNQNGATSVDITLGGMTRNTQSTMAFTLPTSGTMTTSTASAVNGISTTGFNTAYQTVDGTTWLAKTGAGPYTLTAFPDGSYSTSYVAASHVDVTAGDSVSGVTVSSLRFSGASSKTLTLAGLNTVSTGGVLVTPAATGSVITGGTLLGNPNAGNRELVLIDNGSLTVSSVIADSGGASALTVAGSGTTTLSGANTFTGAVSINQGTTKLGVSQVDGISSALGNQNAGQPVVSVGPGATLDLNGFSQTIRPPNNGSSGTILNSTGTLATLTLKQNGGFTNIVTGGNINLISDIGSGNQFQLSNGLSGFSGTFTQRTGSVRLNAYNTDLGTSKFVFDLSGAGAIGTNGTFGVNNRFYLNGGSGTFPNAIEVVTAGFIGQNSSGRTLSGNITGGGVLNIMDGTDTLTGDNSAFAGTINLWQANAGMFFNTTAASSALAKYTFSSEGTASGAPTYWSNIAGGGTVNLGELSTTGVTNAFLRNNLNNTTATFSIGALNTNSTFAGTIANGNASNANPTTQVVALTKVGSGILTLTGASTFSGATLVSAGTLRVSNTTGSGLGTSNVTVAGTGTLGGSGSFTGTVTSTGTVAPGEGVGTLTTGAATLSAGTFAVEVSGAAADKLVSTGSINVTGVALTVSELAPGTSFPYVIAEGSGVTGPFLSVPSGYTVTYPGTQAVLNKVGGSGYASWATANGISGQPASGDFDFDGLTNLVEYGLGTNPKVSSQPPGTFSGGMLTFSKGADAIANGDVNFIIEESDDLGASDPWAPAVTQNAPNPATSISYMLPTGLPKVFARLKVVQIP